MIRDRQAADAEKKSIDDILRPATMDDEYAEKDTVHLDAALVSSPLVQF